MNTIKILASAVTPLFYGNGASASVKISPNGKTVTVSSSLRMFMYGVVVDKFGNVSLVGPQVIFCKKNVVEKYGFIFFP